MLANGKNDEFKITLLRRLYISDFFAALAAFIFPIKSGLDPADQSLSVAFYRLVHDWDEGAKRCKNI